MPTSESTCWTVIRAAAAGSPFEEGLPIRTIVERWGVAAADLHHADAKACQEFQAALLEVVAFHDRA